MQNNTAVIVAVVSRGGDCAARDMPGVGTRIVKHLDWIYNHMEQNLNHPKILAEAYDTNSPYSQGETVKSDIQNKPQILQVQIFSIFLLLPSRELAWIM